MRALLQPDAIKIILAVLFLVVVILYRACKNSGNKW